MGKILPITEREYYCIIRTTKIVIIIIIIIIIIITNIYFMNPRKTHFA